MYRAEMLLPQVIPTMFKTIKANDKNELAANFQLSEESAYIDKTNTSNGRSQMSAENVGRTQKIIISTPFEDWKISYTLEKLVNKQVQQLHENVVVVKSSNNGETNSEQGAELHATEKHRENGFKLDREAFGSLVKQIQQQKDLELLGSSNDTLKQTKSDTTAAAVKQKHPIADTKTLSKPDIPKTLAELETRQVTTINGDMRTEKNTTTTDDPQPLTIHCVDPKSSASSKSASANVVTYDSNMTKRIDSSSAESALQEIEAEQQKLTQSGQGSKFLVVPGTLEKMHNQISRLTLDQRELCQLCFKRIEKQPVPFGLSIMIRLFSNHPQYKCIWPQFKQIPDSSLMAAPELRRHARIYMAGLRLIINSMNDNEKLETALRGIAQAHVKWKIHKSHLINMLPCVIEAFQSKFPMNLDQVQAWTTLFDVIANMIDLFRSY